MYFTNLLHFSTSNIEESRASTKTAIPGRILAPRLGAWCNIHIKPCGTLPVTTKELKLRCVWFNVNVFNLPVDSTDICRLQLSTEDRKPPLARHKARHAVEKYFKIKRFRMYKFQLILSRHKTKLIHVIRKCYICENDNLWTLSSNVINIIRRAVINDKRHS